MLIRHLCARCGHPDFWARHGTTVTGYTRNDAPVTPGLTDGQIQIARDTCDQNCHRGGCQWGEPAVGPRWNTLTGEPVTTLLQPGGRTGGGQTACDCDACQALYLERTAAATPAAKRRGGKRHLAAVQS